MIERFVPTAILLILIVGFGFWINRTGKPYNGMLFNIHKLLALGAVVLTAVRLFRLVPLAAMPLNALLLIGLAVISVIAIFATGAVMSIQPDVKPVLQWAHGITMIIAAGSFTAALLLLQAG